MLWDWSTSNSTNTNQTMFKHARHVILSCKVASGMELENVSEEEPGLLL